MATRVTGLQAELGQRVGRLRYFVFELCVGDVTGIADGFAFQWIATRSPLPASTWRSDAVVGDIELAADEPLRERRVRPVQHLGDGVSQLSRSACSAQNASRSASAWS